MNFLDEIIRNLKADTDVSKQRLLLVAQTDVEDEYW